MDGNDHQLFPRFATELVSTALKDTPVVMVTGPRQCGKTTLVRDLVATDREFITMDDDTVRAPHAAIQPVWFAISTELQSTKCSECQISFGLLRGPWMRTVEPAISGSVSSLCVWLGPVTTTDREPSVGESGSLFREPDAGNLPARFAER